MRRWDFLAKTILNNSYRNMVEVGTADGRNISHILKLIGDYDIEIWCVDPYVPYEGYNRDRNAKSDVIETNKKHAEDSIFKDGRVNFLQLFSGDASCRFDDNSVELVFIDANHKKEYVVSDMKHWYPKVAEGGIFCGHDYREGKLGVAPAVKSFTAERGIEFNIFADDDVWWFYV